MNIFPKSSNNIISYQNYIQKILYAIIEEDSSTLDGSFKNAILILYATPFGKFNSSIHSSSSVVNGIICYTFVVTTSFIGQRKVDEIYQIFAQDTIAYLYGNSYPSHVLYELIFKLCLLIFK